MSEQVSELMNRIEDHWDEPERDFDRVSDMTPQELHIAIRLLNEDIEQLEEQIEVLQQVVTEIKAEQYPDLIFEQMVDQVVDRVLDKIGEGDGHEKDEE